ncbi:MAG: hypothetical protein Q7R80_03665 [bacterium]|nr:hypothetical protein [bacterium]
MAATKPCPEERCRQMRFFGSAIRYRKGHPKCERCKGSGVIEKAPPFDATFALFPGLERYREYIRPFGMGFVRTHDFEGDPLPQPIKLILPTQKP